MGHRNHVATDCCNDALQSCPFQERIPHNVLPRQSLCLFACCASLRCCRSQQAAWLYRVSARAITQVVAKRCMRSACMCTARVAHAHMHACTPYVPALRGALSASGSSYVCVRWPLVRGTHAVHASCRRRAAMDKGESPWHVYSRTGAGLPCPHCSAIWLCSCHGACDQTVAPQRKECK